MPTFPAKTNYLSGDVLTAAQMVDVGNGLNDLLPDAKGSLTTVSAANTPAQLTVGNNGETLVADSSTSTGLRYNPQNALANPVINGGFDIWQRGTSISLAASASNTFTADRWCLPSGANQALTISRQSVSDSTNLPNIQYALRFQRNSGQTGTGALNISQSMETTNSIPFAGKTVTISFYARAGANYSPTSSALSVFLSSSTGTDQNWQTAWTGESVLVNQTSTLTTTWQRFSYSANVPTTSTQLATIFRMSPTGTAGANDWFEVTGVQIDLGTYTTSSAPTFRRTGGTLSGELCAAQRYYVRFRGGSAYSYYGTGNAGSTTQSYTLMSLPVTMRVEPHTLDYDGLMITDAVNIYGFTGMVIDSGASGMDRVLVSQTGLTGLTQYRLYYLANNASTGHYIGFSAEL